MALDILYQIKKCLLTDRTASVPGLGVFYLKHTSSRIDPATNKIYPPKSEMRFKLKPKTRGDRLIEMMIHEYGLDHIAAKEAILTFSEKIKNQYKEQDEARLEGIGRLFNDSNNNLLFDGIDADAVFLRTSLPDFVAEPFDYNKRKETVSEPVTIVEDTHVEETKKEELVSEAAERDTLEDEPVIDNIEVDWDEVEVPEVKKETFIIPLIDKVKEEQIKEEVHKEVPRKVAGVKEIKNEEEQKKEVNGFNWLKALPLFMLFGIALLSYGAWKWFDGNNNASVTELTTIDKNRINQSPTHYIDSSEDNKIVSEQLDESSDVENSQLDSGISHLDEKVVDSKNGDEINSQTELDPESNKAERTKREMKSYIRTASGNCVIIVGSFGRKSNVNKMLKKIEDLGYTTHVDSQTLKLTRVGVSVDCNSIEGVLSEVKHKLGENAWILE